MNKRALLIGSELRLKGVQNDVSRMNELLTSIGFETTIKLQTDRRTPIEIVTEANRQDILDAYNQLIEETCADDVAVVYYAGHGGFGESDEIDENGAPKQYQFILPFDFFDSTEGDFRGITSLELSVLATRLSDKTKNTTIILDCCHSSMMSRDLDETPRALPEKWLIGVAEHVAKLKAERIEAQFDQGGNRDVVRLVASGQRQSAYEYTNGEGVRTGRLTDAFIATVEAAGTEIAWQTLGDHVRERILTEQGVQRPEVEGPSERLLFSTKTADTNGVLAVTSVGGEYTLNGGRIVGVNVGDTYKIARMQAHRPQGDELIAIATVEEVTATDAFVSIDPAGANIPAQASAFPYEKALSPSKIAVFGRSDVAMRLGDVITQNERTQLVKAEAEDGTLPPDILMRIVVEDDQIQLWDPAGSYMLMEPKGVREDADFAKTIKNIDAYTRAQALLKLASGTGVNALDVPITAEIGYVVDGEKRPIGNGTPVVEANGTPIYIRIKNSGKKTVYVSLFDVGIDAKITSLTKRRDPRGIELQPDSDYVYGKRRGVLKGASVSWPGAVPTDGVQRPESIVIIASDQPTNLISLEGDGMKGATRSLYPSHLERLADQIGLGNTRNLGADDELPQLRYAVKQLNFMLAPPFLIDDTPDWNDEMLSRSISSTAPTAPTAPTDPVQLPKTIVVRLKELIVHRNRALLSTTIRVDSMVVTGTKRDPESESFYIPGTTRFSGISNETRLPMDNMIVYHGPAAHFVDFAVWVSRDQQGSLDLGKLVEQELNSAEFKAAAATIGALAVTVPQTAVVIAAIGSATTLINIGGKVLLRATGSSIGLYRTSHLASERFGVGSHPQSGVMSAQDFSFSYEIVAAD